MQRRASDETLVDEDVEHLAEEIAERRGEGEVLGEED